MQLYVRASSRYRAEFLHAHQLWYILSGFFGFWPSVGMKSESIARSGVMTIIELMLQPVTIKVQIDEERWSVYFIISFTSNFF